jgi:hypothetical protein
VITGKTSFWNPYTVYCAAFLLVVLTYSLQFSSLYPDLTPSVIVFLVFCFVSSGLLAVVVSRIPLTDLGSVKFQIRDWLLAAAFIAGFALEFLAFGSIPLLQGLSGTYVDYTTFGIPTFHVVLEGVCSFYSVFWWDSFLVSKKIRFLLVASISVVTSLLMLSRGGALIHIFAFTFAYGNRIGLRRGALLLGTLLVGIVLGFGYLGEVRMGSQGENFILKIGGANERFLSANLPDSTFWFYLYVSSPLANFQYTDLIASGHVPPWMGIVADFTPDFVSKHFISTDEFSAIAPLRVAKELTVATAYARSRLTLGWAGPYALHAMFLAFAYCGIRFCRYSKYYGSILALLCAQGALMFFDNMMTFAGALIPILVGFVFVVAGNFRSRPVAAG